MLSPFFRKVSLIAHITFSVGWFGAVAAFLAIAIVGLISQEPLLVRSAYIAMEVVVWFIIVPACLGALITGLIQSFGTNWGLFKHYWVFVKLILTLVSTIVLFLHMQPISYLADIAYKADITPFELRGLRIQLIADAGAALLVLLVITTISVFKPWGRTNFGPGSQKKTAVEFYSKKSWKLYVMLGLIGFVILLFIIMHLNGGMRHH